MKYSLLATVAALVCQLGTAHALQHPRPAVPVDKGGDPHVQVANYDPSQPVLVVGAVGRPLTITFSPTESIRRVVLETGSVIDGKSVPPPWDGPSGDQAGQSLGNVLPLWAMRAGRSNAQVITTTSDGTQRVYQFQFIALPPQPNDCATDDCDDPHLTTGLTFIYPPEKKPQSDPEVMKARAAARTRAAEARLKTDIFYGVRNWKYDAKGDPSAVKDLAPDQVSDNSEVTGFLYRGNRQVPSFYVVEADGTEREVRPVPDKDLLVVYETDRHWRLRKGGEVIDLFNVGYDSIGVNPYTGTTSPNVIRTIRTAEGK
jgi:type IV secretion system protein VirB9